MELADKLRLYDLARDVLLRADITELPADVFLLCEKLCVKTVGYSSCHPLLRSLGALDLAYGNDGLLAEVGLYVAILYNDFLPPERQRYVVAHELGHHLLGHRGDAGDTAEREADFLASCFLNPTLSFLRP